MAAVATVVAAMQVLFAQPAGSPSRLAKPAFPATTRFYADPDSAAAAWAREHPEDRRAKVIRKRIARHPQAAWFTETDPPLVERQVRSVVDAATVRHTLPVLVAYAIPGRDCGDRSSGGAGDLIAYRQWIQGFARGIGAARAVVVLEPDALGNLGCLDRRQRDHRYSALSSAGRVLQQYAPRARVYYDAGNSAWLPVDTMAERLERAGVERYGDGIALNVSNFNATGDEIRYGLALLRKLGDSRLGAVIDTSRNGMGPARKHRFCDPPGRKLGNPPTADTGIGGIDAYLWVKHPGQADGCAAAAGVFLPDYAYRLAH